MKVTFGLLILSLSLTSVLGFATEFDGPSINADVNELRRERREVRREKALKRKRQKERSRKVGSVGKEKQAANEIEKELLRDIQDSIRSGKYAPTKKQVSRGRAPASVGVTAKGKTKIKDDSLQVSDRVTGSENPIKKVFNGQGNGFNRNMYEYTTD